MTESQIELGHFGGWTDMGVVTNAANGTINWPDPMVRNLEMSPQYVSGQVQASVTLRMPPVQRATVGAEYNIFIFTPDTSLRTSINLQDSEGLSIEILEPRNFLEQGYNVTFISNGTSWIRTNPSEGVGQTGMPYKVSAASWPILVEEVTLSRNQSCLDAYQLAYDNGYRGEDNYRIIIKCDNIVIGSHLDNPSVPAFTTGNQWGTNCSVRLELINSVVAGWGGRGADSNGQTTVAPGNGHDAIHAHIDMSILADGSSVVTGGGGGGNNFNNNSFCGGGGNGANMTSTGALVYAQGGAVTGVFGNGTNNNPPGERGNLTQGGFGNESGASWGGGSAVTAQPELGSTGGATLNTPSTGTAPIVSWTLENGFRWGENGEMRTVTEGVSRDITRITQAASPAVPSFAREGVDGELLEVGDIIRIEGTYSSAPWTPGLYQSTLWELTEQYSGGIPHETFRLKTFSNVGTGTGVELIYGVAGANNQAIPAGTLTFTQVTYLYKTPSDTASSTL
jgi:hypothetical protein